MLKNTLLGLLGGAVVGLLLGLLLVKPPTVQTIREVVREMVGGVPGNEFQNSIVLGGLELWGGTVKIRTASSTVCELLSPPATSTLVSGAAFFTDNPTTSISVAIGKSAVVLLNSAATRLTGTTTLLATSTIDAGLGYQTLSAFATPTVPAANFDDYAGTGATSTLFSLAAQDRIFSPKQHLTVKINSVDGRSMAGSLASGTCSALWQVTSGLK